jgi:N-acetylneuraminic acid mutarotase
MTPRPEFKCRLPAFALLFLGAAVWTTAAFSAEPTAAHLMRRAHDGRAVWIAFPGFSAEIVATQDQRASCGALTVSAEGELTLKLDQSEGMEWVQRTLSSVVNHRLSADDAIANVEFADQEAFHPLGRLLCSRDASEHSMWRVKDDVMTEVHRAMEKTRFIISVAEVSRNAEGKHLPRSFTVTTWNTQSGAIESARQVFNEWQRVGAFDLPTRLLATVSKSDGSRTVEEIVITNHKLAPGKIKVTDLAPLNAPVTSFGAAVAGGYVYLYGGHLGSPHEYSADLQAKKLLRLNLAKPEKWETVGEGPRRTGLAMVAYQGHIYRIGGWEAKNAGGSNWDLYSSRDFARFDVKSGQWIDLAPLPEGRSSHDAAVMGSKLYVIGGWELKGAGGGDWHETAYVCDLADRAPQWRAIAKPPFNRRALAVAAHAGKIYVIGGMTDSNETTTAVDVYDPQSDQWSEGPKVPGENVDGFGISAFGTDLGLFTSTRTGAVFRLNDNGNGWTAVGRLNHPRFFHRLVAADNQRLIVVGGTSRAGKIDAVESLELSAN